MAGFRKRIFSRAFNAKPRSKRFKRRRIIRRSRKKSSTQTTQSGFGIGLRFRSRKWSKGRWNRTLWNSTQQKTHYRSVGAVSGVVATPVSNTQATVVTSQALDNGTASFWQTGGGVIEVNDGAGIPTFEDDIIIRGGMMGLSFYNDSTTDPVEVKAWLVKNSPRPTASNVPGTVAVGWDPSTVPEFSKDVGRIIYSTKFLLEPNATSTIERRIGIQKIDQEAWASDAQRFLWLIYARDFDAVTQNNVRIVAYFNLSFSADVNATGI